MRNLFAAHVPPDGAFFESLWKTAIVVLDTNVVLNLYRFSDSTRDEVLAVLRQVQDRLWLPNQVAWEFFRRRAAAMTDNERDLLNALNKARRALEDSHAGLRGRLADTHHLDEVVQAIDAKVAEVETARNTRLEHYSSAEELPTARPCSPSSPSPPPWGGRSGRRCPALPVAGEGLLRPSS